MSAAERSIYRTVSAVERAIYLTVLAAERAIYRTVSAVERAIYRTVSAAERAIYCTVSAVERAKILIPLGTAMIVLSTAQCRQQNVLSAAQCRQQNVLSTAQRSAFFIPYITFEWEYQSVQWPGCGLDDRGAISGVEGERGGGENFPSSHNFATGYVKYSEYVFVAPVIQWPFRMCAVFSHYPINGTIFEKKLFLTLNAFFDLL